MSSDCSVHTVLYSTVSAVKYRIELYSSVCILLHCSILYCPIPRVGHVALKSASPQVFFVAPERKLRFSKAQLRSLRFKLLDATGSKPANLRIKIRTFF